MTTLALTAAFVALLWWAGTGLVLLLDHRPAEHEMRVKSRTRGRVALAQSGAIP